MDLLAIAEHTLALTAAPAIGIAIASRAQANRYLTFVRNLRTKLKEAIEEGDRHRESLEIVNQQRAAALERARAKNIAQAAERRAKKVQSDAEARGKTLADLAATNLRPRDEVVADIIRERTGV